MADAVCEGFSPREVPTDSDDFELTVRRTLINDFSQAGEIEYQVMVAGTAVNAETVLVDANSTDTDTITTPLASPASARLYHPPDSVTVRVQFVQIDFVGGTFAPAHQPRPRRRDPSAALAIGR